MYKVGYYTLAKMKDESCGNIRQFNNTWYTEQDLDVLQKELERVLNIIYGEAKYHPVITEIKVIEGHGGR